MDLWLQIHHELLIHSRGLGGAFAQLGLTVTSPLVRREPLDQHADHATRRVKLTAVLPLRAGELRVEVFVDAAQNVL